MIIFGTRGVTTTPETGEFFCPGCNMQHKFRRRRVRRFFTLYFIPIIPMDKLGEYIECHRCGKTWDVAVLDFDPDEGAAEFEAVFHRAVKRVMVAMLLADGVVEDAEIETVREIYGHLTNSNISRSDVQKEITNVQQSGKSIMGSLSELSGNLNDQGKEMVIRAAYFVAASDGEFHQDEKELLVKFGRALDMTAPQLKNLINSLMSES